MDYAQIRIDKKHDLVIEKLTFMRFCRPEQTKPQKQ